MKQAVLFDLDGTMWDATSQLVPAWNTVLAHHPETSRRLTLEDVRACMGKTVAQIAQMMLPDVSQEEGEAIVRECCIYELAPLLQFGGTLYPHLEETLMKLHADCFLGIVSNCEDGYVQTFLEHHELDYLFDDFEIAGRTKKSKGENIRLLMERNGIDRAIYVGDTQSDFDAAQLAKIPFVHAAYGFGSIDGAAPAIHDLSELLPLVPTLL